MEGKHFYFKIKALFQVVFVRLLQWKFSYTTSVVLYQAILSLFIIYFIIIIIYLVNFKKF